MNWRTNSEENALKLDPRTMLFLLVIGNISVFAAPSILSELILTTLILLLALFCKAFKLPFKMAIGFYIMVGIDFVSMHYFTGSFFMYLALFARFLRKIVPCGMLGAILIQTTKVNHFMAALSKLRIPKGILIPLTVMLRYFPAIKEDYIRISKSMKMRGIKPGVLSLVRQPSMTIECIYVPIMMSASRRADELSAAAITRGIENPQKRTSLEEISLRKTDYICMFASVIFLLISWRLL